MVSPAITGPSRMPTGRPATTSRPGRIRKLAFVAKICLLSLRLLTKFFNESVKKNRNRSIFKGVIFIINAAKKFYKFPSQPIDACPQQPRPTAPALCQSAPTTTAATADAGHAATTGIVPVRTMILIFNLLKEVLSFGSFCSLRIILAHLCNICY